jgi:hypothetical protein
MRGLEIHTAETGEQIDLHDILDLCLKDAARSTWRCRYVECEGASAQAMEHAAEEQIDIPGEEFLELVEGIDQTIEGDFEARAPGKTKLWLLIRAIDGTSFEVFSTDRGLLTHIQATFRDVRKAGFREE